MYIALEGKFSLPRAEDCLAWSAEGRRVLGIGRSWLDLMQTAALALQCFHSASGFDAAVWVLGHELRGRANERTALVTLFLGTDGRATAEHLGAMGQPFAREEVAEGPGMV